MAEASDETASMVTDEPGHTVVGLTVSVSGFRARNKVSVEAVPMLTYGGRPVSSSLIVKVVELVALLKALISNVMQLEPAGKVSVEGKLSKDAVLLLG